MGLLLLLDESLEALELPEADIVGTRLENKLQPWMSPDLPMLLQSMGAMAQPVMEVIEDEGFEGEANFIPGYGRIFDPKLCPGGFLAYLGQFVGVSIPIGTPEAEARQLVKNESGLERGTQASVESAIQRSISRFWMKNTTYLIGELVRHEAPDGLLCYEVTKTFTSGASFTSANLVLTNIQTQYELLPREKADGESSPFYYTVIAHGSQLLPVNSLAAMEANVDGVRPAGLIGEYVLTEEPLQTDPLIDQGTLAIEAVTEATIEDATLASIT
jgi:hypothetical protein